MICWVRSNLSFRVPLETITMLNTQTSVHLHEDDLELYLRGQLESERLTSTERHLLECKIFLLQLSNSLEQHLAIQMLSRPRVDRHRRDPSHASRPMVKGRSRNSIRYPLNDAESRLWTSRKTVSDW